MRLVSNPTSVDSREISVLAVCETILAVLASILIAVHLDTTIWIAVSASVAPFLLLRTKKSTELGLRLFERFTAWSDKRPAGINLVLPGIGAVCIRVFATVRCAIWHPIETLRAIPENWARIALCVDTFHPPEIVPAYHLQGSDTELKVTGLPVDAWQQVRSASFGLKPAVAILGALFCIILFGPPLLYRWSLKATSLVYSPLLWVLFVASRKIPDVQIALDRIRRSDLSRIITAYSVIILAALASKLAMMVIWDGFADWWAQTPLGNILAIYVAPAEVPLWQVAAAINAIVAISLFVFAGAALMRFGAPDEWPHKRIEVVVRSLVVVRSSLTLYTIACTLYITLEAAKEWDLPALGMKLFPWQ